MAKEEAIKIEIDEKMIEDTGLNAYQNLESFENSVEPRYDSATNISGGKLPESTTVEVGTSYMRLDGRFGIVVGDGTNDRLILGKIPAFGSEGAFVGIKQSKEGQNVFTSAPEDVMFQSNRIYVQFVFNTFTASPNEVVTDPVGFVNYSDEVAGAQNRVARIDFYKPTDVTFTEVILHQKLFQGIAIGGAVVNMQDLTTYLNPTSTKTTGVTSGFDFYRYSGGTTIRSLFDQTSHEEEISNTFSGSQISDINDGWNSVLVQHETNDVNSFGFVVLNLVCTGYKTFS